MKDIKIISSAYAKAKHCVTNFDLAKIVDTSDEWIRTRTGIETRYLSSDENTSDLAYRAAKAAIDKSAIDPSEIQLLVVATMSGDHITPSTACILQAKLGLNEQAMMAFDVNAACSGFIYALQIASAMLQENKCALIVGAETLSKIIDWQDRNTCVLFGDGAGAMLIKKQEGAGVMEHYAQSIGDINGVLQAQGIAMPPLLQNSSLQVGYLCMEGREVFRFAIKAMEDAICKVLMSAKQTIDAIDLIIPHQANLRIIKHVAKKMNIDQDKFYVNLQHFGNTSAASVAIAFAQAQEEKKLHSGMRIILVGFGAGFTYGASYIEL
ncbi:MAG: ketoacyl-ACP synthase III [Clostridia bacterium]|nr:ketoacyl-ACP synthase III [Erysipelotrichia bacterium]NCC87589.1 ketoacyl-ACP synthase III [Clostridia bacterium]